MFNNNICPNCKTLLSHEQKQALQTSQRKGGLMGLGLGLIGAALGVYFGITA